MEGSAFLPSPPNEQEKEKEEPNQGKKLNKALMGGLVVGLALLIVVIVIAVLATASAGDETSAVPQQLQMERAYSGVIIHWLSADEKSRVFMNIWMDQTNYNKVFWTEPSP